MIDTIVLTIPYGEFYIAKGKNFNPPITKESLRLPFGSGGYQKHVLNPTRINYITDLYTPRVTYIRRLVPGGLSEVLRVEFSAPKLLFLNNVDEIKEDDFELLSKKLIESLLSMGIHVDEECLSTTSVSAIHFCKNIPFTNYISANQVIKSLSKIDVPKSLDFNHRHFQNGGQALYIHSNSHQFVIYDKIRDSSMPKGRGMDSNDTLFQQELFKGFGNKRKPLEIVRLEVRLTSKQKILSVLNQVGFDNIAVTFRSLFSKEIAQKILVHYWNTYFKDVRYKFAFSKESNPETILNLILSNQSIKCTHALSLFGLYVFVQTSGIRPLKSTLLRRYTHETWYRLSKEFTELSKITGLHEENEYISTIENELATFTNFKLKTIKN